MNKLRVKQRLVVLCFFQIQKQPHIPQGKDSVQEKVCFLIHLIKASFQLHPIPLSTSQVMHLQKEKTYQPHFLVNFTKPYDFAKGKYHPMMAEISIIRKEIQKLNELVRARN